MKDTLQTLYISRGHQAYRVPWASPREAKGLLVHEASYQRVLVLSCQDLEIDPMDIKGIIHHILEATVL